MAKMVHEGGYDDGVKVGGRKITNLWKASDIVLLADSEAEIQEIVNLGIVDGTKLSIHSLTKFI